jgi:hypothetical protein
VPFDRGAHWVHCPDINPVASSRRAGSTSIRRRRAEAAHRQAQRARRRDGGLSRDARAREPRDPGGARGKADVLHAGAAEGSRRLAPAVEFVLGPFGCGKNLDEISAMDFARSLERDVDAIAARVRRAAGEARRRSAGAAQAPVDALQSTRNSSRSRRRARRINARAAIVTVSTGVLGAEQDQVRARAAQAPRDAIAKLSLGAYEHVALELKGNPLQCAERRSGVREGGGPRTAALLANVSGTPLAMVEVAGKVRRELASRRGRDDGFRDRLARRSLSART